MRDLWTPQRTGPQLQMLEYRFEKAGQSFSRQAIPWNADAVIVEATIRPGVDFERCRKDYVLSVAGAPATYAPSAGTPERGPRVEFRLPVPRQRTSVELKWRARSLGQMTLPVLSEETFCRRLSLDLPTLAVRIGEQIVPCQTFVATQCQELIAAGVLTSESCLAPLVDLDAHVQFRAERGGPAQKAALRLTSTQLAGHRALVQVGLPRPRRAGQWHVTWRFGDVVLASLRLRGISKPQFQRSLRLTDGRFVVQNAFGGVTVCQGRPPATPGTRLGPCFLVRSSEPGMAGLCTLQVRTQKKSGAAPPPWTQNVLVSDGPTPVAPGTIADSDLADVRGFELRVGSRNLGVLPLEGTPAARFNAECGFESAEHFLWNDFADQELQDRLGRLLHGS
jgi:hypothetical protein